MWAWTNDWTNSKMLLIWDAMALIMHITVTCVRVTIWFWVFGIHRELWFQLIACVLDLGLFHHCTSYETDVCSNVHFLSVTHLNLVEYPLPWLILQLANRFESLYYALQCNLCVACAQSLANVVGLCTNKVSENILIKHEFRTGQPISREPPGQCTYM